MTLEFTFEIMVVWDSILESSSWTFPQHNVSRSGLLLDQVYMKGEPGWITVNPTVLPCTTQLHSFRVQLREWCLPIKSSNISFKKSQCFSHVWWWHGTPIKRKHGAFHPTIKLGSSAFTKTCNTCRSEQGVPKGTCESETKIWSFGYLDHLYHGPDCCEFVRHGFWFFQWG